MSREEFIKNYLRSLDAVMLAQADLVEVLHTLRQVLCVKG